MASRSGARGALVLLLLLVLLAGPGARGARGSRGADKQNSLRRAASGVYQGASGLLGEENVRALQKVSGARRVRAKKGGRGGRKKRKGLGALALVQQGAPRLWRGRPGGRWGDWRGLG